MSKNSRELTRAEVAKALGKDKSWVIREEKAGRLKPVRIGKKNARLYDEQYVRQLKGGGPIEHIPRAQAYVPNVATSITSVSPQVASKVITRLAAGATRLEVLAEFDLYPHQVEELDAARMRLCGGFSLTAEHLDEIGRLLRSEPFPGDPDTLIAHIGLVAEGLVCVQCRHCEAAYCDQCLARHAQNAVATMHERRERAANSGEDPGQYRGAGRAPRPPVPPPRYQSRHERVGDAHPSANAAVTTREMDEDPSSDRDYASVTNPRPRGPVQPIASPSSVDVGAFNAAQGNESDQHEGRQGRDDAEVASNAVSAAASADRMQETDPAADIGSPTKVDPNDLTIWDKELPALKREHAILARLLANSPVSDLDDIASAKEGRDPNKGGGGPRR